MISGDKDRDAKEIWRREVPKKYAQDTAGEAGKRGKLKKDVLIEDPSSQRSPRHFENRPTNDEDCHESQSHRAPHPGKCPGWNFLSLYAV